MKSSDSPVVGGDETVSVTDKGRNYLNFLRDRYMARKRAPLPANAAKNAPPHIKRRQTERPEFVMEHDDDGKRVRTHQEQRGGHVVREEIGTATGQAPVMIPGGGEVTRGEMAEILFESTGYNHDRDKRDVQQDYLRDVETQAHSQSGRKTFGVPRRSWKGE